MTRTQPARRNESLNGPVKAAPAFRKSGLVAPPTPFNCATGSSELSWCNKPPSPLQLAAGMPAQIASDDRLSADPAASFPGG